MTHGLLNIYVLVMRHTKNESEKHSFYEYKNIMKLATVTRPPLECYLHWVPETTPTPPRDHSKENLPPVEEPRKLPRKMRPRRRKKEHHQHPGTSGSLKKKQWYSKVEETKRGFSTIEPQGKKENEI